MTTRTRTARSTQPFLEAASPGAATPEAAPRPPAGSAPPSGSRSMTTGTQRAGLRAAARRAPADRATQRLRDYVTLTKPRIISLLLVTTLTPMVVAAGGWPAGWLVLWTMLGGYLMAGGANTLNMVIDRDIDARMGRTALRPIPSGRMAPSHALGYGLLLASSAFLLFWVTVNPVAALLALAGLLYYVFVYTRWLKRRTPQNIVIGGGAGAFPPLVGWAAVTGSLSVTALLLFAIVVLWTPPHFWALALVKQKDYGRVGVPMAPNVWGEERTLREMRVYAVALVIASLLPVTYGGMGAFYGAAAIGLGGWLLLDLHRLTRALDRTAPAWRLYKDSLLYLALLFVAMAVDVGIAGLFAA